MVLPTEDRKKIISEFAQSPNDTGSAEVQVALLTKDINELTGHCQANPKDFSAKRGLLKKVCQRKRFLRYLENNNEEKYKQTISRLGLRK